MAWSTLAGLALAFAALLASNLIEHGNPLSLLNASGAVIVFGGTIGSALVCSPQRTLGLPAALGQILQEQAALARDDHRPAGGYGRQTAPPGVVVSGRSCGQAG